MDSDKKGNKEFCIFCSLFYQNKFISELQKHLQPQYKMEGFITFELIHQQIQEQQQNQQVILTNCNHFNEIPSWILQQKQLLQTFNETCDKCQRDIKCDLTFSIFVREKLNGYKALPMAARLQLEQFQPIPLFNCITCIKKAVCQLHFNIIRALSQDDLHRISFLICLNCLKGGQIGDLNKLLCISDRSFYLNQPQLTYQNYQAPFVQQAPIVLKNAVQCPGCKQYYLEEQIQLHQIQCQPYHIYKKSQPQLLKNPTLYQYNLDNMVISSKYKNLFQHSTNGDQNSNEKKQTLDKSSSQENKQQSPENLQKSNSQQ